MIAPAHCKRPAEPSAALEVPFPETHLSAYGAEGTVVEAPLTSEPPLPDAEPLTSEPPLAAADSDFTRP
ncbi:MULTISPECIES: hypothetical protein [Streptomyces]|uniref:Uncharacterized protein n=1 Tax=Streptomyces antibioticus TaxID=1890 RepID=A0ABX3LK85_STRAT|nr:hypothetical protein [Streptomyces antibioticus]MCX4739131.1 hypothetical protein [Streptomyces antibioticus]OOQ52052.1 hypothetical protein AFM16_13980 [Streptomyces antibioticus]